jgi:large subunit ribosomal protein L13Ae
VKKLTFQDHWQETEVCVYVKYYAQYLHLGIFLNYLYKRHLTNPTRGHFHHRSPSKMLYKAVRGMVPYKTERGAQAMRNLQVYEGVPRKFIKTKKVCVPAALRAARLRPGATVTRLGNLASSVGWKQATTVANLEKKRKLAGVQYYKKKLAKQGLWQQAKKTVEQSGQFQEVQKKLAALGY